MAFLFFLKKKLKKNKKKLIFLKSKKSQIDTWHVD